MLMCVCVQVCVPAAREACLAPGCLAWGECRDLGSGKRVGLPEMPAPPDCWPNQARLSNTCARLSLLFDRAKLPRGASVESVCAHLRRLTAKHQALAGSADPLVILCDLKAGLNDTVEVTMVSTRHWCHVTRSDVSCLVAESITWSVTSGEPRHLGGHSRAG